MSLAFPLCREPRHEEPIRRLLERAVDFLVARLSPRDLVGVVLTGSFARGEGSVVALDRHLRVLGDIEFFLVVKQDADERRLAVELPAWGREASATLGGDTVRVDLEFGLLDVDFLRRRGRPSIFLYDLLHHGKVLWGPEDLLAIAPAFGPERIPPDDALFLLFNRIVEQLEAYERLDHLDGDGLLDVAYQRYKLPLDLAGSVLAFTGGHVPLYRRRPTAFAGLVAETPSLAALLPPGFGARLEEAARVKTAPQAEDVRPAVRSLDERRAELRRGIAGSVPTVGAFLAWELQRVVRTRGSLPQLLAAWLRTPSWPRRLREWAKLALNPTPAPVPLAPARAAVAFSRTTPRALLYAAGALAFLDLANSHADLAPIAGLLPVRRGAIAADAAAQRRAIVALWRWCVRNS